MKKAFSLLPFHSRAKKSRSRHNRWKPHQQSKSRLPRVPSSRPRVHPFSPIISRPSPHPRVYAFLRLSHVQTYSPFNQRVKSADNATLTAITSLDLFSLLLKKALAFPLRSVTAKNLFLSSGNFLLLTAVATRALTAFVFSPSPPSQLPLCLADISSY